MVWGSSSPFLLPTHSLPTILVRPTVALITGTVPASSASGTLRATHTHQRKPRRDRQLEVFRLGYEMIVREAGQRVRNL
jgi:hypothetical protein